MRRIATVLFSLVLLLALAAPRQVQAQTDFEATLLGLHEVEPFVSQGQGSVTATLKTNTLTLQGSFDDLEGKLLDIAGTPAHVHLGGPDENGPVVITLSVAADTDSLGGSFPQDENTYDLTALDYPDGITANDVMQALQNGNAYVNVHTEARGGGELRGQLLEAPNQAPNAATIQTPTGAITVEGAAGQTLTAEWTQSTDPNGDAVVYVWQLATDQNFDDVLVNVNVAQPMFAADYGTLDALLAELGVAMGEQVTLYHRAIASDGSADASAASVSIDLTRGFVYDLETTLAGINEVDPALTDASGEVQFKLDGDSLWLTGSFDDLSSTMTNPAGTPAHIHLGGPDENGGILIPLVVEADPDSMGGSFPLEDNAFNLTELDVDGMDADSIQNAIRMGHVYVNVHTEEHGGGELRGTPLPAPNAAPPAPTVEQPADGATVTIEGDPADELEFAWTDVDDPDGNDVVYVAQIALDEGFTEDDLVDFSNEGDATTTSVSYADLEEFFEDIGVAVGEDVTLYLRIFSSDGSLQGASDVSSFTLERGVLTATPIAEAREAGVGETVTIQGVVTRSMGDFTYIQDETAGLTIRQTEGAFFEDVSDSTIAMGTELRVTGTLGEFRQLLQINEGDLESYEVLGTTEVPAPQMVTLRELNENGEAYEAELVEVQNLTTEETGTFEASTSYDVTDAAEDTTIVLRIPNADDTAVDGTAIPEETFTFTGVVGQFDFSDPAAGYQLLAIAENDVSVPADQIELAFSFDSLDDLNSWKNTSSEPGYELSISDDAVEGTGSLLLEYDFVADESWGGSVDINANAPGGAFLDMSDSTGLVFDYKTLDPVSPATNVNFVVKLVDTMGDGEERWETAVTEVITDDSGEWQEVKIPFEAFAIPDWAASGDETLDLDAIAGWEMQVIANDQGIGTTYTGSVLLDDLGLYRDVIDAVEGEQPLRFALRQNYPNPFNPSTTIAYVLDEASHVTLHVFNVLGQHVVTLVDEQQAPGRYTRQFDAHGLASGVYVYHIEAGDNVETRRMILIK